MKWNITEIRFNADPVTVKRGLSMKAVRKYAKDNGWAFRRSSNIFGGYFVDSDGRAFEVR